jgi:hypothetical protein
MAACMATEYVIRNATAEQVVDGCRQAVGEMGLQVIREESTDDGQISVLAGEGALVPFVVKALQVPLGLDDFVRAAQRTGVHIGISPQEEAIHLYVCGIALEETSGKFERFTEADLMEQVTDTMEAWDFKDQFAQKIKARFPKIEEVK